MGTLCAAEPTRVAGPSSRKPRGIFQKRTVTTMPGRDYDDDDENEEDGDDDDEDDEEPAVIREPDEC